MGKGLLRVGQRFAVENQWSEMDHGCELEPHDTKEPYSLWERTLEEGGPGRSLCGQAASRQAGTPLAGERGCHEPRRAEVGRAKESAA